MSEDFRRDDYFGNYGNEEKSTDNDMKEFSYSTAENNYRTEDNGTKDSSYGTADYSSSYEYNTAEKPAKEKKSGVAGKIFKKGVAIVVSAALFGCVAGGALYGSNYFLEKVTGKTTTSNSLSNTTKKSSTSTNPVNVKLTTSDMKGDSGSSENTDGLGVESIVKACMPSVVAITNVGVTEVKTFWGTYQQDSKSAGSGVIIAQTENELLILTNNHVISGSKELTVVFSYDENSEEPKAVTANIKGTAPDLDLAVIAIQISDLDEEILNSISIAVVGNSDSLELGEQVVAIGNALGYGQSVTTGIVSALHRQVTLEDNNGGTISNYYIQTDAAINPGNSGGAMLNMKGELVGINSAKVASSSVEGMGYAIPITDVYDVIEQMMNEETKIKLTEEQQGYLGIGGDTLDSSIAERYHVSQGVYLTNVYDGYAAANAGLEKGDIITHINGTKVDSLDEMKTELAKYAGGEKISITYIRYDEDDRSYAEHETEAKLDTYETFKKLQEKTSKNNSGYYNP